MASQETVKSLVEYYVNLLIVQYHNQPKAVATINILAEIMLASGVYFDVENAYNIIVNPLYFWDSGASWDSGVYWDEVADVTAVGVQLDVIGKYVGVNRYYTSINLIDYFALVTYAEASGLPSSPPAFGCSTYATFSDFDYNGTLTYGDIVTSQNALSDTDFLALIQFMILCNNCNLSAAAIDTILYKIFGSQMRAETNGTMSLAYFIAAPISTLINTIIFKGLLPAPMGVSVTVVETLPGLIFGATTYAQGGADIFSPFAFGCSTYSDYDSLSGQTLTYSQMSAG